MKNNYQLEKLKKIELGPNESRETIYSLMLQPTLSGDFIQALNSLRDLEPHMTSDYYYVAHKLIANKGNGPHRSVALALSRMADGAHLLVERALDHLDEPEMAAILARKQSRVS
ncbi:DUF6124 family protein [Pseudomonas sp. BF-R-26]|uniref:DUF6124 family protein n=1 Tax=Pseudomonas sp. BF-R-26 TaxID=2832398 RepID=UPI001CBE382C|nr:hypothetical protein [Pseudomonas sp. BF-R-26]